MLKYLAVISVVLVAFSSCTYESEEEIVQQNECPTEEMSFENDVKPILQANGCLGCHNSSTATAGIILDEYESIKPLAESGTLLSSINWDGGAKKMPPSGEKTPQCGIDKIGAWIQQGIKNN